MSVLVLREKREKHRTKEKNASPIPRRGIEGARDKTHKSFVIGYFVFFYPDFFFLRYAVRNQFLRLIARTRSRSSHSPLTRSEKKYKKILPPPPAFAGRRRRTGDGHRFRRINVIIAKTAIYTQLPGSAGGPANIMQ